MAVNPINVGIVTTLRDAGDMIDSFIAWHLASGFSHLFLFFDDPADPDLPRLAANPAVTAIPHDAALRRAWAALPEYPYFGQFIDSEVMARQVLNAALAMDMARARGLAWLLHIDADELFCSDKVSVAEHFLRMDREKTNAVLYINYEAAPEKIDIRDPFRAVDLFKIPDILKPGPATEAGRELLAATPQLQPKRMHFYSNGKSAVRLSARNMRPRSVHAFDDPVTPLPDFLSSTHYILHYTCCGFENFWRKYRRLGRFSDKWYGRGEISAIIGPLHTDARDVVATGDRALALDFYRRRIAIEDAERAEALIRHKVLVRIEAPRRVLDRLRGPESALS